MGRGGKAEADMEHEAMVAALDAAYPGWWTHYSAQDTDRWDEWQESVAIVLDPAIPEDIRIQNIPEMRGRLHSLKLAVLGHELEQGRAMDPASVVAWCQGEE